MAEETPRQGAEDGTFVITDKREQARQEAAARREAKEADDAARAAQEEQLAAQRDAIRAAAENGDLTPEQEQQLLETQAQLAALQDEQSQQAEAKKVLTAFLVYTRFDGSSAIAVNIDDLSMDEIQHVAQPNHCYTALQYITMDMQAQQAAMHTQQRMLAAAQAMTGGGMAVPVQTPNGQHP